jgi:hypothetical protein
MTLSLWHFFHFQQKLTWQYLMRQTNILTIKKIQSAARYILHILSSPISDKFHSFL